MENVQTAFHFRTTNITFRCAYMKILSGKIYFINGLKRQNLHSIKYHLKLKDNLPFR